MGFLWKALAPKPLKQARRAVTHPVRTTVRAATPKPIRQATRAVYTVRHPASAAKNATENAVIDAVRGRPRQRRARRLTPAAASMTCYLCGQPYSAHTGRSLACPPPGDTRRLPPVPGHVDMNQLHNPAPRPSCQRCGQPRNLHHHGILCPVPPLPGTQDWPRTYTDRPPD